MIFLFLIVCFLFGYSSFLQKHRENRYCCHTRESGYPEVFDFKEYWIPDLSASGG